MRRSDGSPDAHDHLIDRPRDILPTHPDPRFTLRLVGVERQPFRTQHEIEAEAACVAEHDPALHEHLEALQGERQRHIASLTGIARADLLGLCVTALARAYEDGLCPSGFEKWMPALHALRPTLGTPMFDGAVLAAYVERRPDYRSALDAIEQRYRQAVA